MHSTPQTQNECVTIDPRVRVLWLGIRQGLIIVLGAIEDYLGVERSIVPRHKRRRGHEESEEYQ